MWTARQSIFTNCKIKPETNDTKQPSSPVDRSNLLLFLFFKSFLYSTENSGAPIPRSLLKRPIVRLEKSLLF